MAKRWNQKGRVVILPYTTDEPISLIGEMAGICYGSDTSKEEKNFKRGLECIMNNHGRTLEFPKIYMVLEGWSAKVLREAYTHIIDTTRLQASTRYINYDNFKFITPPSIQNNDAAAQIYNEEMENIRNSIKKLEELGIPKEDASGLLPLNYESKMVWELGLRELIAVMSVRKCARAYHEIRDLMKEIEDALAIYSDQWNLLVKDMKIFKCKCEYTQKCSEKFGCGRFPKEEETNAEKLITF